jgi:hypothetical protein
MRRVNSETSSAVETAESGFRGSASTSEASEKRRRRSRWISQTAPGWRTLTATRSAGRPAASSSAAAGSTVEEVKAFALAASSSAEGMGAGGGGGATLGGIGTMSCGSCEGRGYSEGICKVDEGVYWWLTYDLLRELHGRVGEVQRHVAAVHLGDAAGADGRAVGGRDDEPVRPVGAQVRLQRRRRVGPWVLLGGVAQPREQLADAWREDVGARGEVLAQLGEGGARVLQRSREEPPPQRVEAHHGRARGGRGSVCLVVVSACL